MTDVATLIRTTRTGAGLTQTELARRSDTSQPALARYETGVAMPTLPTLERLLLGCEKRMRIEAVADGAGADMQVRSVRGQIGPRAQALRHNRRRLLDAAQARGVRRVRVFGSIARGDESAASDVDLLVDLAPGRTLLDLAGFRRDAEAILDGRVDVATPDMLKPHIRAGVLSEALPL